MGSKHDAWLIDLDGTLYRPKPVKRMMAAELLFGGWSAIPTLRAFRRAHEHLRETLEDEVENPYRLQLQHAAEATGRPESAVSRTVQEWMFDRPLKWIRRNTRHDLVDEIRTFKRRGGKLAVVSDYPALKKLGAIAHMPDVDVVVANGEPAGPPRLKPHPDGYLEAARRLGVPTERCLILGDRDDADGEAARRAGIDFRLIR